MWASHNLGERLFELWSKFIRGGLYGGLCRGVL